MTLTTTFPGDFPTTTGEVTDASPVFRLYRGAVEALAAGDRRGRLIVTPNLDHLRLLDLTPSLRAAYARADVIINDSRFLDKLVLRGRVPCLPGSELAPMMLDRAAAGSKVFVVGADPAVEAHMTRAYPKLAFEFLEPSMGFVKKRAERRAIARAVMTAAPDILFVCTGAPQSELLAAQIKRAGCEADILCCGSALHFLAGTKSRAPAWTRVLGAEWFWRFVTEGRTRRRYAADAAFLIRSAPAFLSLRIRGRARFGRYGLQA